MRSDLISGLPFGRVVPWLLLLIGIGLPLVSGSGFDLNRYELLFFYAMLAIALNFAFGFGGQLALGQPVVVAAAAYTAGLLSSKWNWDIWQTLVPAVGAAIITGIALALPSLRVRGWYFGIISFFAIAVMPDVISAFATVTGGDSGLAGIRPMQLGPVVFSNWAVYETIFLAAALTWVGQRNLIESGWGVLLRTMRDHPVAASASGADLRVTRAWVYVLNAVACGIAGVLFAHSQLFLVPSHFAFNMILLLIGGMFLGGVGTLWGPVLGISVFEGISFWVGPFSILNQLALGLGVLVTTLGFKGGIVANAQRIGARLRAQRRPQEHADAQLERLDVSRVHELGSIAAHEVGVTVTGVSKRFGGNQALRDVDLELHGGQLVALIGANGSGKTTLLNVISGFIRPDEGIVVLNGIQAKRRTPSRTARLGLGRTFQVPRLVDELTVVQNVQLGLLGLDRQRVLPALLRLPSLRRLEESQQQRARQICRFLGLPSSLMDAPARSLPLGLRRIVEIGRAVVAGAKVICLDEPAAGLTVAERDRLKDVLRALVATGRAVLLVEHNTRFVLDVCDRIVLLQDGVIVGRGSGSTQALMDPALYEYVSAYTV